jgi:uncharacterized membrane protein
MDVSFTLIFLYFLAQISSWHVKFLQSSKYANYNLNFKMPLDIGKYLLLQEHSYWTWRFESWLHFRFQVTVIMSASYFILFQILTETMESNTVASKYQICMLNKGPP